jgi:WD40-like Beta Propeller Repeat
MGMTADPARDLVRERARRGSPCSQCGVEPGDARARAACRRIAARGCGEDPLCRLVAGWDRAGGRARARGVSAGGVPYRESGLRDQGLIDPRSGFAARRFTYLRRTDGSPAVRLGEGQALALSPDGKWALAWRTSSSQLVLLPTGVGEAQTLSVPAMTSVAWGTWFPDSRRVLFAAETNGRFRIYVRELGGGETRPIGPPEFTLPSSLGGGGGCYRRVARRPDTRRRGARRSRSSYGRKRTASPVPRRRARRSASSLERGWAVALRPSVQGLRGPGLSAGAHYRAANAVAGARASGPRGCRLSRRARDSRREVVRLLVHAQPQRPLPGRWAQVTRGGSTDTTSTRDD